MYVTVQDILELKSESFELIAGRRGITNRVLQVPLLDFEYTERQDVRRFEDYWKPHDFIVSTFQFARDDPGLVTDAVKKLASLRTAGIAIKNVYAIELSSEMLRFANENDYPVLLIKDDRLFAEDLIIFVDGLLRSMADGNMAERKINYILKGDIGREKARKTLLEINYTFTNGLFAVYFLPKESESIRRHSFMLAPEARRVREMSGSAIVKFREGFYYIHSTTRPGDIDRNARVEKICASLGIQMSDFHIGMCEVQSNLSETKKALLQALYAAAYARVFDFDICAHDKIGLYRLIFPLMGDAWAADYREAIIGPLLRHDATSNKLKLLDFALVYELYRGNTQAIAAHLDTHENTVRYRIARIRELTGFDEYDETFDEQLFVAVKLHRIKSVIGDDFSNVANRIALHA